MFFSGTVYIPLTPTVAIIWVQL